MGGEAWGTANRRLDRTTGCGGGDGGDGGGDFGAPKWRKYASKWRKCGGQGVPRGANLPLASALRRAAHSVGEGGQFSAGEVGSGTSAGEVGEFSVGKPSAETVPSGTSRKGEPPG